MDVITIGSLTLDAFAYTERSKLLSIGVNDDLLAYQLGTKIALDSLRFELGGGGTNSAAVFRALGKTVGVVGKIGSDFAGDEILKRLYDLGIDFVGERIYGASAFSIVLDAVNHERTILAFKGASENPLCETIPPARLYYISSPGPSALDAYTERLARLRECGLIVFNGSSYLTRLGLVRLEGLIRSVDVFICNDEEFELLTGPDLDEGLRAVHALGVHIVVVTRGPRGALVSDGEMILEAPSRPTKLAETTGAGDSFGATFAAGLLDGLPIDEVLDFALIQSASVISFPGPKNGVLRFDEIERVRSELPSLEIATRALSP
jgi:ribokinase